MNLPWQGGIWPPLQAAATFDHALGPTVERAVVSPPLISLMLFPFPAPLSIRNFAVSGCQDAVAALSIDWSFAVIRNPKSVRVDIGTPIGNEPHTILVHKVVGDLGPVGEVMDVFYAVDEECKGVTWIRINLSKGEDGLNLFVIN